MAAYNHNEFQEFTYDYKHFMYQTYYVYIDKDYDPCFLMFSKKNIIIFWQFTLEKSVNAIICDVIHIRKKICV